MNNFKAVDDDASICKIEKSRFKCAFYDIKTFKECGLRITKIMNLKTHPHYIPVFPVLNNHFMIL